MPKRRAEWQAWHSALDAGECARLYDQIVVTREQLCGMLSRNHEDLNNMAVVAHDLLRLVAEYEGACSLVDGH